MAFNHAIIWIDAHLARVVHFDGRDAESLVIARGTCPPDAWFDTIATAAAAAEEILVAGPDDTSVAFAAWVQRVSPAQRARIFDVQRVAPTVADHLLAHARRYFEQVDRPHHLDSAGTPA
jgi:hypothetical protein